MLGRLKQGRGQCGWWIVRKEKGGAEKEPGRRHHVQGLLSQWKQCVFSSERSRRPPYTEEGGVP